FITRAEVASVGSAVVSVIGLVTVLAKVIVSPVQASIIACRSDPAPLSALLVTTGLAGQVTALTADGRPGIRATVADSTSPNRSRRDRKGIRDARLGLKAGPGRTHFCFTTVSCALMLVLPFIFATH